MSTPNNRTRMVNVSKQKRRARLTLTAKIARRALLRARNGQGGGK